MFGEDLTNFSNTNFLKFLAELRVLAKKYKLPARMVEKALFKKNKEK